MATEIRSTRTYWHVQEPNTPNVARVYPGAYFVMHSMLCLDAFACMLKYLWSRIHFSCL